jgi:hypothetical protein
MYLCPTSEDNERQIEEIGAQIQKLEDSAALLQRQNKDLSREHAESIALVSISSTFYAYFFLQTSFFGSFF